MSSSEPSLLRAVRPQLMNAKDNVSDTFARARERERKSAVQRAKKVEIFATHWESAARREREKERERARHGASERERARGAARARESAVRRAKKVEIFAIRA